MWCRSSDILIVSLMQIFVLPNFSSATAQIKMHLQHENISLANKNIKIHMEERPSSFLEVKICFHNFHLQPCQCSGGGEELLPLTCIAVPLVVPLVR